MIEKIIDLTLLVLLILSILTLIVTGYWMLWSYSVIILKAFISGLITFNLTMLMVKLWLNKEKYLKKQ